MAYPVIIYNASTGSDTAASGAGPSTAITGAAATVNGGDPGTVIDLDGSPDLSGVSATGSHAIWLETTSGSRHFSKITAVDNSTKQVTIEDSVSLSTGVNWAIGGKRLTPDSDTSRQDITDGKAGWTFEYEAGTYSWAATQTVSVGDVTDGPITFRAASGASPIFTVSTSNTIFATSGTTDVVFKGIKFTPASFRGGIATGGTSTNIYIEDCTFDAATGSSYGVTFSGSASQLHVVRCLFMDSTAGSGGGGITCSSGRFFGTISGCEFKNLVGSAINLSGGNSLCHVEIEGCLMHGSSTHGVNISASNFSAVTVSGCTISGSGSAGISLTNVAINHQIAIRNTILANNGTYGIDSAANGDFTIRADYNAYYSNTSGNYNNVTAGTNDVVCSVSPFTNSGTDDYSLNNTSGGGASLRAAGSIGAFLGGTTTGYEDIGAVQHQDSGGGSASILVHPGMSGGMRG